LRPALTRISGSSPQSHWKLVCSPYPALHNISAHDKAEGVDATEITKYRKLEFEKTLAKPTRCSCPTPCDFNAYDRDSADTRVLRHLGGGWNHEPNAARCAFRCPRFSADNRGLAPHPAAALRPPGAGNGIVALPIALSLNIPIIGEASQLLDALAFLVIAMLLVLNIKKTAVTLDSRQLDELTER